MTTLYAFTGNFWASPFQVEREYRTEIITSRSGREQRRALRDVPRKRVEFVACFTGDCLREFERQMTQAQRFPRLLADRVKYYTIPTIFADAANSLVISPMPEWIVADAELVLSSGSSMERRSVLSVVGTTVTFNESNTADWPAETRLHAGLIGWVDATVQAPRMSLRGVRKAQVGFDEQPGSSEPEGLGAATTTLSGREVFLKRPDNWEPVDTRFITESVGEVDFGFGVMERYFPVAFSTRIWEAQYTSCSTEKATELTQFFHRMQGRRGEFYAPTWMPDLLPVAALTSAGTTITVEGNGVDTSYSDSTVYAAVAVKKTDGTWLCRKITGIAPSGGNSVITVSAAWGSDVALSEIDMVCWLPVWRFATDTLTLVWQKPTIAQARMSFQMIENLTEE